MTGYSAVEHLAKTVLLNKLQGGVFAFMATETYSAYFDESRVTGNDPYPVMAGFLSTVDRWMAIEQGLDIEFKKKPAHLDPKKYMRENPLVFAQIFANIKLQPIHAVIERKVIDSVYDKNRRTHPFFSSAYTNCAYCCCERLDYFAQINNLPKPIEVVFDNGQEDEVYLTRGYRGYYKHKTESHLSADPIFKSEREVLPLLAADLYAWLVSKAHNEKGSPEIPKIEEALAVINKIFPQFIWITQEKILEIKKQLDALKIKMAGGPDLAH